MAKCRIDKQDLQRKCNILLKLNIQIKSTFGIYDFFKFLTQTFFSSIDNSHVNEIIKITYILSVTPLSRSHYPLLPEYSYQLIDMVGT